MLDNLLRHASRNRRATGGAAPATDVSVAARPSNNLGSEGLDTEGSMNNALGNGIRTDNGISADNAAGAHGQGLPSLCPPLTCAHSTSTRDQRTTFDSTPCLIAWALH